MMMELQPLGNHADIFSVNVEAVHAKAKTV